MLKKGNMSRFSIFKPRLHRAFGGVLILLFVAACSERVTCGEDHRSVSMMRKLSQVQLATLNTRIEELAEEHQQEKLFGHREPFIPDDLKYLNALYISFNSTGAFVALAKCDVSEGVSLRLTSSSDGKKTIQLEWHAPTDENPYQSGKEVLWTSD